MFMTALTLESVIETREERAKSQVDVVSFHALEADEDHSTSQWDPIKADHNHIQGRPYMFRHHSLFVGLLFSLSLSFRCRNEYVHPT